ncbi:MAG: peptidoglycan editing factor PgeF [Granulosicoccus sp.]
MTFASLSCVVPDWPVSAKVTVMTTTRHGGVSEAPFDALNLGLHVGDKLDAVLENRRRLLQSFSLPAEPIWLNQTHSTDILDVVQSRCKNVDADGAFTRLSNTVLAVLTADCLPIVMSDTAGAQLAVVHAGWRGLAGGIVSQAISRFDKGAEICAWLGPAIGPARFEVGDDVRDAFVQRLEINATHFKQADKAGKYWADLYGLARTELTQAGCHSVGGEYCTHSQSDMFHSHRRDGTASGRMATLAWISAD